MRKKIIPAILVITTILAGTILFLKSGMLFRLTYPRTPPSLVSRILHLSVNSLADPDKCLEIKNYLDTPTKMLTVDPLFLPELCKSIALHDDKALSQYKIAGIKNSSLNDEVKVVQVYLDYSGNVKKKVFLVRKENGKWKLTSQIILINR